MPHARPKKSDPFGVRFDSEEQRDAFVEACKESDIAPADALRLGAKAMVAAFKKFGRIPKDMEIRQSHIGDLVDINELLERVQAVADRKGEYLFQKKPPPRVPHKDRGTGPAALVSDKPA